MGQGLTAAEIEAAHDFRIEPVPVPQWAGTVFVRTLTTDQRDEFVSRFINQETGKVKAGVKAVTSTLLALTVCNEAGELLYPDLEKGRDAFGNRSAAATDAIFDKASELNALREQDIADLAGNLPKTTSGDSSSDYA